MSNEDRRTKTIVVVATLDTRGDEVEFLRQLIENKGHRVVTVDVGVMGSPHMPADFTREKVSGAGGKSLQQLVEAADAGADRQQATDVMIAGARKIVTDLYSAGRLDGILSLGGSTAAATGAAVMKGLPMGLPKLLITTFISLAPVGDEDITVKSFWRPTLTRRGRIEVDSGQQEPSGASLAMQCLGRWVRRDSGG